jgi:glycosyltransferase involved in cell wall biosynthesis
MIKVLFLSAWYPNRYDAMFGLFVQKHAEAVSLFCDVNVLYVHADKNINTIKITESKKKNLTEIVVYYPIKDSKSGRILKLFGFLRAYYYGLKHLKINHVKPDIIHANILSRTGCIAYLISRWKKIPYIVTEHWSRYLLDKTFTSLFHKYLTQFIVKKASVVLTVSELLKNGMIKNDLVNSDYRVIYNVVDENFYADRPAVLQSKSRILHVSCFDEAAKNIKGILRAADKLSRKRDDFELVIIGTGQDFDEVNAFSKKIKFPNKTVQFLGEKTPEEVADWFRNSDIFVLFSNYETAGVVIAESLVIGVPVISTRVGIASELINNSNGILVEKANEDELCDAMNYMLDNPDKYNRESIKSNSKQLFSYQTIGKELCEIYKEIIAK